MRISRCKFGEILCEKPAHGKPRNALVYRKAVEAGSTSAMVGLGGLCAKGAGVKADPVEARKLFEQAVVAGNQLGMIDLRSVFGAGIGVPVDFAKARSWCEKEAAANSAEAMFQPGMMTQDGDGGPNGDAAAAWFEQAAALDHGGPLERSPTRKTAVPGPKTSTRRSSITRNRHAWRRGRTGFIAAAAMSVHTQGQERQSRGQYLLRRR
jgi:hypothetical protein